MLASPCGLNLLTPHRFRSNFPKNTTNAEFGRHGEPQRRTKIAVARKNRDASPELGPRDAGAGGPFPWSPGTCWSTFPWKIQAETHQNGETKNPKTQKMLNLGATTSYRDEKNSQDTRRSRRIDWAWFRGRLGLKIQKNEIQICFGNCL